MAIGFKHRQWEVFVSVSASGPEFSKFFERSGHTVRTRMAADLDYTTADVDYFYEHFTEPEPDRPRREEKHIRLVNPSRDEVLGGLSAALEWLGTFRTDPQWDGGGLHFNYAGHGAGPDGALVLHDETLSVDDFLAHLDPLAVEVSPPGQLQLSAVLDSCHSGRWITGILDSCFHERSQHFVPFNLFAACMHDEFALEDSSLGHGLFTYCFSVRPDTMGSYGAQAVLPDNGFGPSLSIAAGGLGCSLLSAGAQNPLAYWNGAGHLEVAQASFSIEKPSGEFMNQAEMGLALIERRDEVRAASAATRSDLSVEFNSDDEVARQAIRALRQRLEGSEVNQEDR